MHLSLSVPWVIYRSPGRRPCCAVRSPACPPGCPWWGRGWASREGGSSCPGAIRSLSYCLDPFGLREKKITLMFVVFDTFKS